MRIITNAEDAARENAMRDLIRAAAEKTKLIGRLLAATRETRDYMRDHPPRAGYDEDRYRDAMSKLNSLLERKNQRQVFRRLG